MLTYGIYSLTPAPRGDDYRLVEAFVKKENAQKVLDVLESVDVTHFHNYKILELEIE